MWICPRCDVASAASLSEERSGVAAASHECGAFMALPPKRSGECEAFIHAEGVERESAEARAA